jgi:hypothetical protein
LDEFYTPIERVVSENKMIQRVADGFGPQSIGWDEAQTTVYVPLPFWFSRGDMGSALPVDGIYADSIRVSITFRGAEALYVTDSRVNEVTQFPFQGSPFFRRDPAGKPFPGLIPGDPFAKVSAIPNLSVPAPLVLGNAYLLAEYVTLDKPEANRFRQAEFTYPVIQHYALPAVENQGLPNSEITVRIPNPTRHLFMMTQRSDAVGLNAYFLATRDLKGPSDLIAPWWPNTKGLATEYDEEVVPGFATRDSEPLDSMVLTYEGRFVRVSTENMALYRSILPTYELRKTPLFNRYYYCIPFCLQAGAYGGQTPLGEANLDKIINITLTLNYASLSLVRQIIPAYTTYIWAETYNVLKIYGGRAGLLFGY